jgi:hypothetical protein
MQFDIEPHRGIGPVSFGMSREEVAATLERMGGGQPEGKSSSTDCYFRNAFQVSFDEAGKADFMEVSTNVEHVFAFRGLDVFDVPGSELLNFLQEFDQPDPELSQSGYSYTFPGLILTLWGLDSQYDYKGGQQRPMFGAVGAGTEHYLNAIRAISSRRKKHPKQ